MRITQHYWNRYKVQPASKSNPTHHAGAVTEVEKAMDGVGWTAVILGC